MQIKLENVLPGEIERRSFEIIESELKESLDPELAPIIKRVIHTTADFEYVDQLYFSEGVKEKALAALRSGCPIYTDTNMALAGINKPALAKLNCQATCLIAEPETFQLAQADGTTRAVAAVKLAAQKEPEAIFVVGNAPTALIKIYELVQEGLLRPRLVVAVPVGFVNVVQAKELIISAKLPSIVARGRKGGSNVAAAIINALLYELTRA
ncbi:MAG: precorrin-8X methylmutase [Eubacteriales bacterium]|nr:precorrin-8X methylmutase [Eubacteriales bacterium]